MDWIIQGNIKQAVVFTSPKFSEDRKTARHAEEENRFLLTKQSD